MPQPDYRRKKLILPLGLASCLVLIPLLMTWRESRLPVYESTGVITAVQVENPAGRGYSARISIAIAQGGAIKVHVSVLDSAWRAGQRLTVRYFGGSGEVIRATFLGPDGKETGFSQRNAGFRRTSAVLLGLAVAWLTIRNYRKNAMRAIAP